MTEDDDMLQQSWFADYEQWCDEQDEADEQFNLEMNDEDQRRD